MARSLTSDFITKVEADRRLHVVCCTCGTQFAAADEPSPHCPICQDSRQYTGLDGQHWTTVGEMRRTYRVRSEEEEPGLTSFVIEPHFAIGQRAFLVQTEAGNVLWDCLSLPGDSAVETIRGKGGLAAIAISHPHYYTAMVEWSRALGNVPVYLHAADREWVMRPDSCVDFWSGEAKALPGGLTLIRCGGHFPGGTVMLWPGGAKGKGALLSGDIIQVVPDRRFVSFMYSYPNLIPLNAEAIHRITAAVDPYAFDRIYGAFPKMTIATDGKSAVRRSAERYLGAIE